MLDREAALLDFPTWELLAREGATDPEVAALFAGAVGCTLRSAPTNKAKR